MQWLDEFWQSIDNYTENNHLLHRLGYQMHESILRGNHITISWAPSHVGRCGNERANQAAREAAMRPVEFIPVSYRDWFPLIKERTYYLWNESCRTEGRELRTLQVRPGKWKSTTMKLNRSEEAVINRLRLGHTHITHGCLMDDSSLGQRPMYEWCGTALLTVHHIIVECPIGLQHDRSRMMSTTK